MADDNQVFERSSPQVSESGQTSNSHESDSDEEVSMLQKLSLQGFETFSEPVTGTGFIYHDKMAEHKCEWDSGYPENPQRLIQPYNRCIELGLVKRCQRLPIRYATEDEIIWKHTRDHVEIAQSTATMTVKELMALSEKYDAWYANKVTYEAALIAAGSTINMVEHILQDKISNGFAMVRPPGHHAMEQEFNGYCTFNNVALAAQYALNSGIEKILIVDWDVHHGQGTQRMFYDDPRVLYFSIHRYEHGRFWPQLRESDYDYIGEGPGEGFNINIPLNKTGMTDSDYMAVFNMILLPVAYEFQPHLILISSGYDAAVGCPEFRPQLVLVSNGLDSAIGDEKGEMLVTPAMYAQMTHQLMGLAFGRVCVVLEGGYCLKSLAEGCALTLRSLLRDPCPKLPPLKEPSDSIMTTILNAIKVLRNYWKCFKHYDILERSEVCVFADVNDMPPVHDVPFSTSDNRPDKFEIMNCYPVQEEKTRVHFAHLINKLISETNLSVAEHRCCYVFDAEMRSHRNLHDKSHPERPERISKIYNTMAEWNLLQHCLQVASRLARKTELMQIHGEDYLNVLMGSQTKADEELKYFPNQHSYASTYVHQKSVHCALLSCGSLLNVVEAVLRGKSQSGVAIVRPPGHHAESNKAMGFCFINNVAVAAKFAQTNFGLKRILIVDWDVHHGNATQHQFYSDPSVLYISLHRYDDGHFFPGSSDADMDCVGSGNGKGYNVNIPWSHTRMGDAEYIAAFTQIIMPISYQFAPELVLVSAGYDCAVGDPLGGYNVTPACFGHMTHMLTGLANGRVVLSLEGGYNLNSLSQSMATCMAALLRYSCPNLGTLAPNERATEIIRDVLEVQKQYWSSLKGSVRIPPVRQVDNDRFVVDKEYVNRRTRARRSGPSKSATFQAARPSSAGSSRAPQRNVVFSASDPSVTARSESNTSTRSTTTTDTEEHTTVDTAKSTTLSTKNSGDTSEHIANETSLDTTSTSDSSSKSDSNLNVSNVTAGHLSTEDKERLPQISENLSVSIAGAQEPEDRQENADPIVETSAKPPQQDVQASLSSAVLDIISDMQNLIVTDTKHDSEAHELTSRSDALEASRDIKDNQIKVSQSCTQTSDHKPKQVDVSQQQQHPLSAPSSVPVTAVAWGDHPQPLTSAGEGTITADGKTQVTELGLKYPELPTESGDATGAKPKTNRYSPKSMFRSLIYGDEQDPEPLSIFVGNPLMASQEQIMIDRDRSRDQEYTLNVQSNMTEKGDRIPRELKMSNVDGAMPKSVDRIHEGATPETGDGSSCDQDHETGTRVDCELLGACGGSNNKPTTVQELIRLQGLQGVNEMHAVQPLPWCPHLTEVRPLPGSGLSLHAPCGSCGDETENWVCLTCYSVQCSRFVNEHMMMHKIETGHNVVLSFSDLSVWCYGCENYVDNELLFPMKNAAHEIKFGESLSRIP